MLDTVIEHDIHCGLVSHGMGSRYNIAPFHNKPTANI